MDFLKWLIGAGIVFFVASKIYEGYRQGRAGDDDKRHCMTCGTEAVPRTKTKGHFLIEVVLWLCFIVPGLIYSVWRVTSRTSICSACGSDALVPTGTPAAIAQRAANKSN